MLWQCIELIFTVPFSFIPGTIQTRAVLDRESQPRYWLTVVAQDHGIVTLSASIEVSRLIPIRFALEFFDCACPLIAPCPLCIAPFSRSCLAARFALSSCAPSFSPALVFSHSRPNGADVLRTFRALRAWFPSRAVPQQQFIIQMYKQKRQRKHLLTCVARCAG